MVDKSEFDIGMEYSEDDLKIPDNFKLANKPEEKIGNDDPESESNDLEPASLAEKIFKALKKSRQIHNEMQDSSTQLGLEGTKELKEAEEEQGHIIAETLYQIISLLKQSEIEPEEYYERIDRKIEEYTTMREIARKQAQVYEQNPRGDGLGTGWEQSRTGVINLTDQIEGLQFLKQLLEKELRRR